jgi:hypothetical protein
MNDLSLSSYRRRLARALVNGARAALSADHSQWADAMEGELLAISDDRLALRWAVGCFVAGQRACLRIQLGRLSASVPLAMSLSALAMVLGHFALYGIVHEPDEGTPAHVFQLLMILQLPLIAFFAMRWLPRAPGPALQVLALQTAAAGAAIISVLYLT